MTLLAAFTSPMKICKDVHTNTLHLGLPGGQESSSLPHTGMHGQGVSMHLVTTDKKDAPLDKNEETE